jgi:hypothetical protein
MEPTPATAAGPLGPWREARLSRAAVLRDVWGDRLTRLDIDVTGGGPAGTLDLTIKEQR